MDGELFGVLNMVFGICDGYFFVMFGIGVVDVYFDWMGYDLFQWISDLWDELFIEQ